MALVVVTAAEALKPLAKQTLIWTGEQFASAKVQGWFNDGVNLIFGGGDTEQILEKIDSVLKGVQQTANKTTEKLEEGFIRLQKDELRNHFETIDTIFEKIQYCNAQALVDSRTMLDHAKLKQSLAKLYSEQEQELRRAVDRVPELLNHINGFLADREFIKKAAESALRNSKDFLSYYKKMETLFTTYWSKVIQGIVLLNMAHLSQGVLFEEATLIIRKHSEKLDKQVSEFYEVLGYDLCLMAQSVLAASSNPGTRAPVYFASGWGKGINIEKHWQERDKSWLGRLWAWQYREDSPVTPGQWGYQALKVVKSNDRFKYYLEPVTAVSNGKDFDLTKSYSMRLYGGDIAVKDRLNRFSAVEGVDAIKDPAGPYAISMDQDSNLDWRGECSEWHIRPVAVGWNVFYLEATGYRGGEPDHSVLVTSTRDDELEWRENLDPSQGFAGCLDRAYFQLRPAS